MNVQLRGYSSDSSPASLTDILNMIDIDNFIRSRNINGFINMEDIDIDWIKNNLSFSVYINDRQVGFINLEEDLVEVFNDDYELLLNNLYKDVKGMYIKESSNV